MRFPEPKINIIPIERLIRCAEIAKLNKNENIQRAILAIAVNNDARLANDLSTPLNWKMAHELLQPHPFDTPSEKVLNKNFLNENYLLIGKVKRSDKYFTCPINSLNEHGLLLGGSGTGKTTLLYAIIAQSIKKNVTVWIFDKDKEDFTHMIRMFDDLLVFDIKNTPINYLVPPKNVSLQHWMSIFVQVFCKSNSLLDGSESMLLMALKKLFEDFGIFQGKEIYPTFIDLKNKIRSFNFRGNYRQAGYQDSLLNRLNAYIVLKKEAYEYSKGIPIHWFAKKNIVWVVKELTERVARFTMNIMTYGLFLYRLASRQRVKALRNLVVIDEAKWLAPGGFNDTLGFSPLTYLMSQAREAGIGLVLADQTANLDDSVFVNSRIKICFRLGSGEDIQKAKNTMALSKDQAEYITRMDTGECIVRIPKEDPFVISTLKTNFE